VKKAIVALGQQLQLKMFQHFNPMAKAFMLGAISPPRLMLARNSEMFFVTSLNFDESSRVLPD